MKVQTLETWNILGALKYLGEARIEPWEVMKTDGTRAWIETETQDTRLLVNGSVRAWISQEYPGFEIIFIGNMYIRIRKSGTSRWTRFTYTTDGDLESLWYTGDIKHMSGILEALRLK